VLFYQHRELRMGAKHDPMSAVRQGSANPDEWKNVAGRTDCGDDDLCHDSRGTQ
jgi:hypothetical protein